jgi:uncharacterized SAM-binding protein YcdF (DUF218 family)
MQNTPDQDIGLPASLRFLKGLVITLMITMILGVITVVWALVTHMSDRRAQLPALPPDIVLPVGQSALAVTFGAGFTLVVTNVQTLLVFDSAGALRQTLPLADIPPAN